MGSSADPVYIVDASDNEMETMDASSVNILECEGLPRQMWNTKHVTLYNNDNVLVGEGTCHSVNSELVLGAHGPLEDTHVAVHIAKTHSEANFPQEQVYSLMVWPI